MLFSRQSLKTRDMLTNSIGWFDDNMDDFLSLLARHGYLVLALVVGLGACGLPMPVMIALIAAGLACARHLLRPEIVLVVAVVAAMVGDTLLYFLGRAMGWFLLGNMCRVSLNPEACILRSAESFYRRGKMAVIIAKFVPGIGALAAPLAGSMKMRPGTFLRLDLVAAFLYVTVYGGLGFLLGDLASTALQQVHPYTVVLRYVIVCAILGYLGFRGFLFWKQRKLPEVPRITVDELAAKMATMAPAQLPILDVRSHGYYDPDAQRIKGSVRVEPNNLLANLKDLPHGTELYLYCT